MKNKIFLLVLALGLIAVFSTNAIYPASAAKCGNMKWGDTDHGDNNPSSKKFKENVYSKPLCEIAKDVDHSIYANHDSVDWKHFVKSIAFTGATEDQQHCLIKAHKEGNGMTGLGGYEILYCATDQN